MGRGDLTDDQWRRLRPLLPAQRPKTGRPGKDHRTVINGIPRFHEGRLCGFCVPGPNGGICPSALAPGPPWPAVSTGGGGRDCGTRLLAEVQQEADASGQVDWEVHYVDDTNVRAHQHAAGGKKGDGDQALGRSRGGFGTKVHLRVEGQGKPVAIRADPGSAARGQRVRGVDGSRGGETFRAWPSPHQASEGLRRQRVQQPQDSGLSQTTGNSLHHPPENQRTTHWSFQPGAVPATQSG